MTAMPMNAEKLHKAGIALKYLMDAKQSEGYQIKQVIADRDTFGSLVGYQFDSDRLSGYVYLWSSGMIARELWNRETDEYLIPDNTSELSAEEFDELLWFLASEL